MTDIKSVSRNNFALVRKTLNRHPDIGALGHTDGSVAYPGDPGFVWARKMQAGGGFGPPFIVRGPAVAMTMTPGKPIQIGFDNDNRYRVLDVDYAGLKVLGVNPTQDNVVDPNANNSLFVNQAYITTGFGQIVAGTLQIAIRGWLALDAGVWYKFEGTGNFTGNVPASGSHCAAVVAVLRDYSAVEIQYSTSKSVTVPLDTSDLNEAWALMSSATNTPIASFDIGNGQTSLTEANRWLDIRQLINLINIADTDYYQTVQANGTPETQRPILDFIDGTNTTVTVTDDGAGTRTKVAINAPAAGAPTNASYITEVPESGLSNEFALSTLATGLLKNTTSTGVPSIAAASDINSTFGSTTQNEVYASPNGLSGTPIFRALVDADLPVVDAGHGGTGIASPTAHDLLVANGASAMNLLAPGSKGNIIASDGTDFQTLAVGTDGQGVIAQAAQTEGLYWRDVLYPKNELINGGFVLNSRGAISPQATKSYSDDSYSLDQWYILTQTGSVSDSLSITAPGAGAGGGFSGEINQDQAVAQRFGRAQLIEGYIAHQYRSVPTRFQGQVRITNSQAIRFAILEWTGTDDSPTSDVVNNWTSSTYTAGNFFLGSSLTVTAVGSITPSANTWTPFSITGTPSTSCNNLYIFLWTEGTAALNFQLSMSQCMLVSGIDPVPWVDLDQATESIRAQRFLKVFYSANGNNTSIGLGLNISTTVVRVSYSTPVPFRITPSLTATAADWDFFNAGASALSAIALNAASTPDMVLIDGTHAAGTNGAPGILRGDGSADRYLILSAEL